MDVLRFYRKVRQPRHLVNSCLNEKPFSWRLLPPSAFVNPPEQIRMQLGTKALYQVHHTVTGVDKGGMSDFLRGRNRVLNADPSFDPLQVRSRNAKVFKLMDLLFEDFSCACSFKSSVRDGKTACGLFWMIWRANWFDRSSLARVKWPPVRCWIKCLSASSVWTGQMSQKRRTEPLHRPTASSVLLWVLLRSTFVLTSTEGLKWRYVTLVVRSWRGYSCCWTADLCDLSNQKISTLTKAFRWATWRMTRWMAASSSNGIFKDFWFLHWTFSGCYPKCLWIIILFFHFLNFVKSISATML